MQRTLGDFLGALRASEVRVSPAEAIDAHRAVAEVGYGERALLKDALCVTLAKSPDEVGRFDACFELFFRRDEFTGEVLSAGETEDAGPSLEEMLEGGDGAGLAAAMEAAATRAGAGDIRLNTQRALIARRILDDMGLRDLEGRIADLRETGGQDAESAVGRLAAGRARLFAEANRFVERQAQLYAGENGRRMREAILAGQRLTAIEPEDFRAMEALVRRIARRLASRYSRKRHRARKGRLDVRRTIRRSMGYGGVPFEIAWKTTAIDKPKIVAICDVSRSVAGAARFLLLFLYSLGEVVERLDAYAFSDRLICVNDVLADETVDDAIALILGRIGFRPTDYGRALEDFRAMTLATLDRRTTVIVLGDGRSNHADPRLDLMGEISARARAVIWLNPEPRTYWGQGDSRMDAYARFCHVARTCNTLNGLERIVEEVLRTYLPR
ncbi:MAG: VWA domain-containing protein [Caulobacteraceae bacterium]